MKATPGVMRIGKYTRSFERFPTVELSKIVTTKTKVWCSPVAVAKGYRCTLTRRRMPREAIRFGPRGVCATSRGASSLMEQGLLDPPTANTNGRHVARDATASAISAPAPIPTSRRDRRSALSSPRLT